MPKNWWDKVLRDECVSETHFWEWGWYAGYSLMPRVYEVCYHWDKDVFTEPVRGFKGYRAVSGFSGYSGIEIPVYD